MIKSKALEVNLASYYVDVAIDPKYSVLEDVFSRYQGLMEGLNIFLKELSHPYKNWQFIVKEARSFSLDYFHFIYNHPKGPKAAEIFIDIFIGVVESAADRNIKADAVDNLLLFLHKIIKESGVNFGRFLPVLNTTFIRIRDFEDEHFYLFVKSFYQIRTLAADLTETQLKDSGRFDALNSLFIKYFQYTYSYWLSVPDPISWFQKEASEIRSRKTIDELTRDISHRQIKNYQRKLEKTAFRAETDSGKITAELLEFPGYRQFIDAYRETPQKLLESESGSSRGYQYKLLFLLHLMNISGLSMIHEEALSEINKTLEWIIAHENYRDVQELIRQTFTVLKERTGRYPETALNCVLNMGKGVYKTGDIELVNYFIDSVIELGFQSPMIKGVGNDWQIRVNRAHIQNIRTWLEIIELKPKWSTGLLSALVVNLALCGVFIRDTDLFPRNITRFLNSDVGPVYNLAKQLARLFPVYFNDIGAEGRLRDISTMLDEITSRKDVLVHCLRKQSHVESSNRTISFMEATLNFWKTRDKKFIEPFVPPTIYNQIESTGHYIDGLFTAFSKLEEKGIVIPDDLLGIKEGRVGRLLENVNEVSDRDKERVKLAIVFYQLLHHKYNLDFIEMDNYLARLDSQAFPEIGVIQEALAEPDSKKRLFKLLDCLDSLNRLILSSSSYEAREDIYKKRHIALNIPSMYGSYHENKFDALGLVFRLESLINVLLEELIEKIDLALITKATFYQIYDRLRLFEKALKLDGISSFELERQLDFLLHSLEVKGFTFTQYLDIFKGFAQAVKNIINDYYNNVHERNLNRILSRLKTEEILPKYLPRENGATDPEKLKHRISEVFFRERIALSLGLQQLDLFLSRILKILFDQSERLSKYRLRLLLNYDPHIAMTPIDEVKGKVSGIIYLGNKGLNMVKLKKFGLPIPPGFIITTEVFRCRELIDSYPPAEQNFKEQIAYNIFSLEKITGKTFGDPSNPLLLSVRSGSSISQPGMMDSFLNVGINEKIAAGISAKTGNAWFAWDNYRRFLQGYGMAFDLERDQFDAIIGEFKQKTGIPYKRNFTGEQMREVAFMYRDLIRDSGIEIQNAPFEQLWVIIKKVFDSWESSKAKAYRKIMGISDDWGTAVTIQTMVFGNISKQSGTGVFFTHNPRWSGDTLRLWGDFTLENQGEDVVSGLVKTLPISIFQQEIEKRETDITLETHFPDIYTALRDWAKDLVYEKGWSPQEIEFTFEGPSRDQLYLLQTREMAMRQRKKTLAFHFAGSQEEKFLAHGIGVSGGAMSGRIVFSLEEINNWRFKEPETSLILVRSDT
ncbi:MAG: pyruvate, phosphate dikinase, partial [Proteobacteria bacterium]|nr:pyruvate, phosphate dikinase [Pseudomonadota bacterium]